MDYFRPATLDQAFPALLAGARALAGGTDLYPGAGARLGPVVDLTGIGGLTGIAVAGALRIGALTTWSDIAQANLPPACAALQQAALQVGGRQIQNSGTIGGNLCNASPAADGIPPLLVLDAQVELAGPNGIRVLPLANFLQGPRRTALAAAEVMTAILVPEAAVSGTSTFEKLGARAYLVISIAMVAVRLVVDHDTITQAAIAVGSCSGAAQRLPALENSLLGARTGARFDPDLVTLSPIDDIRATATYRAQAAATLITRALGRLT